MQVEWARKGGQCLETETLVDFLADRVAPAVRARVERHASRCASCRKVMSALAGGGAAATASPTPRPCLGGGYPTGTRVGRYLIEREAGAGGMGVVYAARDPELDRMVALKLVRGDGREGTPARVRREAQAMAQLAHPNVVAVYDVGAFEDCTFIAMEYVAGQTLARWADAPRMQREIVDAYRAAGRGLAAAHAAGIVHRDFKPENVFVGSDGRVRVGDFGLARTGVAAGSAPSLKFAADADPAVCVEPATRPILLTAPGVLLGTPCYMAPELYAGADADARSDQFSFCVALFTTLYGERPFEGDTFDSLVDSMRAGRLRVPRISPRPPKRVHAAICRGLATDPANRFASLDELLHELAPASHRWARRMAGLAIGGLAAAAIVLAIVVVHARPPVTDQRCSEARDSDEADLADILELGLAPAQQGQHAEADEQLRRVEAIAIQSFGADDPGAIYAVAALGELRTLQSRRRDAVVNWTAAPARASDRSRPARCGSSAVNGIVRVRSPRRRSLSRPRGPEIGGHDAAGIRRWLISHGPG